MAGGMTRCQCKVTDKLSEIFLAMLSGRRQVAPYETGTMVGAMAKLSGEVGGEACDLPLYFAGGGSAFGIRRAGVRGVPEVSADV